VNDSIVPAGYELSWSPRFEPAKSASLSRVDIRDCHGFKCPGLFVSARRVHLGRRDAVGKRPRLGGPDPMAQRVSEYPGRLFEATTI